MQLGGVPETDARWFFQQFIIAVDYCHRLGIANRDIKVPAACTGLRLCALAQCSGINGILTYVLHLLFAWQVHHPSIR